MTDWRQEARGAASRYGIDPDIFARQIGAESNFDPNARSSAGARGIAQIMPGTAKGWGVNPDDPRAALDAAARNMAGYIDKYGGWKNALVAYNAGPGRVGKPLYSETRGYVDKILGGTAEPQGAGVVAGRGGTSSPSSSALSFVFQGSPFEDMFSHSTDGGETAQIHAGHSDAGPSLIGGPGYSGKGTGAGVESEGGRFGLRVVSDGQRTGGVHSPGSLHYSDRARDFGDASNDAAKLTAYQGYAFKNPGKFKEFFFDKAHPQHGNFYIKNGKIYKGTFGGHADHIHAAR